MVFHRSTAGEVVAATGFSFDEDRPPCANSISPDADRLDISRVNPCAFCPIPADVIHASAFSRAPSSLSATKVSVSTPWDESGYVVVDVPEAVFSNLGLTYLAHARHVPTLRDQREETLPRLEWQSWP